MRFILASSSPRRREMIASLGIDFEIIKPDIDETQHPGEPPLDYVQRLSREKAQAVAHMVTGDALVLSADTIVVAADTIGVEKNGDLLGKPVDAADARAMLRRLRARPHTVCTSFTVCRVGGETITGMECTQVFMRDYTDDEINAYIATGDPFDKAGSYAIQHAGFHPVAKIEGCYNNVVGLPLCAVKRALNTLAYPAIQAPQNCDCPRFKDKAFK
jgi:septum formation protein